MNMTKEELAALLHRLGLSFVFVYAAVAAWFDPFSWIGFFPEWMRMLVPDNILLKGHSIAEIILALWILSGWRIFWPSIFAALAMAGIVFFNFGALDIVFRDVGIMSAALALAVLAKTPGKWY